MPIYLLNDVLQFPPVAGAEDGIVAVGGDLSAKRLLIAYQSGIFPWFNEDEPIIWWSPDPRFVLFPERLHVSRSMSRILKKKTFEFTYNHAFGEVISNCQQIKRHDQNGTWITNEMRQAYTELHELGIAHSIEVWQKEKLVGGMYGIALGNVFCGESMFSSVSNASKAGFIWFTREFKKNGGQLIDCQVYSRHVESLGAENISRKEFLKYL